MALFTAVWFFLAPVLTIYLAWKVIDNIKDHKIPAIVAVVVLGAFAWWFGSNPTTVMDLLAKGVGIVIKWLVNNIKL